MDIEQKQAEIIDLFVKRSSVSKGDALASILLEATSHPSLVAFSEILALPHVAELEGTTNSVYLDLDVLRLFAHGTWIDYKCNTDCSPQLVPDQVLKLKQLTVLTLAEINKVLPYDLLMAELDITNVRELEDFLIHECMYAGIVRGKLDQLKRCFEVQFAAGRDLRPGQLGNMMHTLENWLSTSEDLLVSIQDKIKWADNMSEVENRNRKEVEERVEEMKMPLSMKDPRPITLLCDLESCRIPKSTEGGFYDVNCLIPSIVEYLGQRQYCGKLDLVFVVADATRLRSIQPAVVSSLLDLKARVVNMANVTMRFVDKKNPDSQVADTEIQNRMNLG